MGDKRNLKVLWHKAIFPGTCSATPENNIFPYENLQPDTARIQPDSGQKAFFAARMERDKARHEICLALQRERDICLATVRAGIWLDLNVTGRD